MPDNRTGYDLRAHMLELAKAMLSERMHCGIAFKDDPRFADMTNDAAKGYGSEDVIAEAKKLYEFVCTK